MSKPSDRKRNKHKARRKAEAKRRHVREQRKQHEVRQPSRTSWSEHNVEHRVRAQAIRADRPHQFHESAKDKEPRNMVRLYRVLNRLAQTSISDNTINALASSLLQHMEDGYRLVFPILMHNDNVLQCVALLALADDPRWETIREWKVTAGATHVLLFFAFASEDLWFKHVTHLARLFPEQPEKTEFIIG
jgi:hypothetical protein